jgi:hypothetical protein
MVEDHGGDTPGFGDHASNNLANRQLILDNIIPRTRLRPGYGQGWQAG